MGTRGSPAEAETPKKRGVSRRDLRRCRRDIAGYCTQLLATSFEINPGVKRLFQMVIELLASAFLEAVHPANQKRA